MELKSISRRSFLEASALAGAAALKSPLADGLVKDARAADAPAAASAEDETKIVKTCCRACIHNCGILAHVRNGRVVKIEGNPDYPMSRGSLCAKALSGVSALYHPNRNKYPLIRAGERGENKWRRISWKEAIDIIAKKMEEVRRQYGAEAVLVTTGGGNPAFRALQPPSARRTSTNRAARSATSRAPSRTTSCTEVRRLRSPTNPRAKSTTPTPK